MVLTAPLLLLDLALDRLPSRAQVPSDIADDKANPKGILEAYWLYIEGVKPEGTPNSLIAAQPVVVKDLREAVVRATQAFMAPPDAGTYNLRIHLTSTSVIGVNLAHDCTFTVVEDDVPALV